MVAIVGAVSRRTSANCLERALVLWTLLRLRSQRADLCVGFGLADGETAGRFGGHAWVELDAEVLGDAADHARTYQVISRNGLRVVEGE